MTSHRNDGKLPNIGGWRTPRPLHSAGYRVLHRLRSVTAASIIAALTFAGTAVGATLLEFNSIVKEQGIAVLTQNGSKAEADPVDPNAGKPISFLLLGQDTRDGAGNAALSGSHDGEDAGTHQSDTTMVVQISADRSYVNIVSIPRDSLVNVPSCETPKGTIPAQYDVMFNSIFNTAWDQGGGLEAAASCTMHAVNALTGLDLQQFIVVDFAGLRDMIDAIGGVTICVPEDTKDTYTDLDLKRGLRHLDGTHATMYARMRHGTGTDGSDIMRTTRQQYLIKQLVNEARSKSLFTNTSQIYQLGKAALKSLNMSSGLANLPTLAGLALSLKNLDTAHVYAQTIPVVPAPSDPAARVVWSTTADEVWTKLRKDKALTEHDQAAPTTQNDATTNDDQPSPSDSESASATPTPTATPDPKTGLITQQDGSLLDPNTGGIVDPQNGTIRDANTGQYIGIADRYLNATVCAVPAQK
ncbi:LCP family protein [Bifidobacterium mongoliense]|uniref:LCP family protein n=1 Tax=Bifidobacterium mongoliense TaxID=518643 RepID=UPI002A75EA05|nr:LCP family protein [Bifidobacterium mongoliense]MDY3126265.1 LCP family protein [Bifidobacterium mongoliense]